VLKTLEQFQWNWPKKINRLQIQNLFRLTFIEQKANVPQRVADATDRTVTKARAFSRKNPTAATAAVIAGAVAIGTIVWAAVRLYTR